MTTGVYNYGSNGFERVINWLSQPWLIVIILTIVTALLIFIFEKIILKPFK